MNLEQIRVPISLSVRFPFVQAGTEHIRPYDIAAGSLRSTRVGTSVRRHRGGDEGHYCIFACPSYWGSARDWAARWGRYQPIIPTFIVGWYPEPLWVELAFGVIERGFEQT